MLMPSGKHMTELLKALECPVQDRTAHPECGQCAFENPRGTGQGHCTQLLREISTSDVQMRPLEWQKVKRKVLVLFDS